MWKFRNDPEKVAKKIELLPKSYLKELEKFEEERKKDGGHVSSINVQNLFKDDSIMSKEDSASFKSKNGTGKRP